MTKTELLKVIRAHCLDCCCGSSYEVQRCGCPTCNLYPVRFGKDPTKRVLSPEEKAKLAERLTAVRKKTQESSEGASDGD